MIRAGTLLTFFVLVSIVSAGHKPMELHKMRFDTFKRSVPVAESEMAWTEITFFGGSVFTINFTAWEFIPPFLTAGRVKWVRSITGTPV